MRFFIFILSLSLFAVSDRGRVYYTPEMFGATSNDPSDDDSAALQEMCDRAAQDGISIRARGYYHINNAFRFTTAEIPIGDKRLTWDLDFHGSTIEVLPTVQDTGIYNHMFMTQRDGIEARVMLRGLHMIGPRKKGVHGWWNRGITTVNAEHVTVEGFDIGVNISGFNNTFHNIKSLDFGSEGIRMDWLSGGGCVSGMNTATADAYYAEAGTWLWDNYGELPLNHFYLSGFVIDVTGIELAGVMSQRGIVVDYNGNCTGNTMQSSVIENQQPWSQIDEKSHYSLWLVTVRKQIVVKRWTPKYGVGREKFQSGSLYIADVDVGTDFYRTPGGMWLDVDRKTFMSLQPKACGLTQSQYDSISWWMQRYLEPGSSSDLRFQSCGELFIVNEDTPLGWHTYRDSVEP